VQALGFGKQIHNIINLLHKEAEDTKTIPTKNRVKELIDEHFYMRYASDNMEERLKNSAAKSLQNYVHLWEKDFSLAVKTEQAFEFEMENALINGSIDMIKRDGADEKVLEIIDFKTGKPSNDLFRRYELQVQLYTIAAQEALGKNAQKAMIHYIDSGSSERQLINTSRAALDNAKVEIKFAINGITSAEFKRDARTNNICKECDWKTFCPKRKGHPKK
jgi:DNA helicase-2/ATP-dependent DNA helicase PcrA